MPRRNRPFIPPGTLVINGQTQAEVEGTEIKVLGHKVDRDREPPTTTDELLHPAMTNGKRRDIPAEVVSIVDQFDEFALQDRDAFVRDLMHEVAQVRSMRMDLMTRGRGSKPHAWTVQVLFQGIYNVMERHGLRPTIGQSLGADSDVRQSAYLRLACAITTAAGYHSPADAKDVALKAKDRIRFST